MIVEQNGGFVSHGDGPKRELTQPLKFKVTFTAWPSLRRDCSPENESIVVKATGYDEAVANAIAALKEKNIWKRVIAIFAVTFVCDKWGRQFDHEGRPINFFEEEEFHAL